MSFIGETTLDMLVEACCIYIHVYIYLYIYMEMVPMKMHVTQKLKNVLKVSRPLCSNMVPLSFCN